MNKEYFLRSEFLKKSTGFKSVMKDTFEDGFLHMVERRSDRKPLSDFELATLNMDCVNIDRISKITEVLLYQMKAKDISFLRNFTFLENLDLVRLENLDLTDISLARNMMRLKELFICDCHFAQGDRLLESNGMLRRQGKNDLLINNFHSLRSITLENIHGIEANTILRAINNPEFLKILKLNNETFPTRRTMQGFINLEEVVIGNNMAKSIKENNDISRFLENIPHPEKVETLYIREANLNNSDLMVLRKFKNLKNLYIDNIKDANVAKILENVYGKGKIENLIISQCDLKNADMSILQRFHKLKNLYITNNENVNGNSICAALAKNPNFEILNICNNKISDYKSFSNLQAKKIYAIGNKIPLRYMISEFKRNDINYEDRIIGFDGKYGKENFLRIRKDKKGEVKKDIHINSKDLQEISKFIKFADISTLTLQLDSLEDIKPYIAKLSGVPRLNIEIKNTKGLRFSQACYLQENFNVDKIIVADEKNSNSSYERNSYKINDYIRIKRRINEIIAQVPKRGSEAEKFLNLYSILQEDISYDKQILSTYESYSKNNVNNSRNMTNGLLYGKCVCAGFSDILKNCLSELGIESKEISGNNHQWNQVKLDGRWYNVDLTVDASRCKNGQYSFSRCLLSDKDFPYSKFATIGDIAKCTQTYDQKAIEYFSRKGKLPARTRQTEFLEKINNNISTKTNQIREFLRRRKIKKLPKAVTIQEMKQEIKRFEDMPDIETTDSFLEEVKEQSEEKKIPEYKLGMYNPRFYQGQQNDSQKENNNKNEKGER